MATGERQKLGALLGLCRPGQWVKNTFVLAPVMFGRKLDDPDALLRAFAAFVVFCVVSSAVYVFNDLCDRREDREHPVKRHRPLADGTVTAGSAVVLSAVLLAVGLVGAWQLGTGVGLLACLYAGVNVAYSLGLKRLVILDVLVIAVGFVLRILAGSAAAGVAASHWLVLSTIFISLFLGFTKRRTELLAEHSRETLTRQVLKDYSTDFLDQVIAMVTGATLICYALYTVDEHTAGGRAMLFTVPLVIYGMFRYVYIIYHLKQGEDPTRAMLRDVPIMLNVILWGILSLAVIHYGAGWELFPK